jgi:flagellar motor protein MotB
MDGHIFRQSSSYRQGLVLGLTMAEIMILLIFCLLITMAAFLKREQTRRQEAEQEVRVERVSGMADHNIVEAIKQNPELYELLRSDVVTSSGAKAVDEYWRELVESRDAMAELKKGGLSEKAIRDRLADAAQLNSKGINVEKALRDADIVGSIEKVMPSAGEASTPPQIIADAVGRGLSGDTPSGHQWPPIIRLSEADGNFFKTGSAELSPEFHEKLMTSTPVQIAALIKKYDVDVIEVVGHTDEQPVGVRQSNLDRGLVPVLRNYAEVSSLAPADNAGLGLARAVSVLSVLSRSPLLAGYKLIPLSGAQLVNTDETLAIDGVFSGDVRERRRIEIRLRKSQPHDLPIGASSAADALTQPRAKSLIPDIMRPYVAPTAVVPSRESAAPTAR